MNPSNTRSRTILWLSGILFAAVFLGIASDARATTDPTYMGDFMSDSSGTLTLTVAWVVDWEDITSAVSKQGYLEISDGGIVVGYVYKDVVLNANGSYSGAVAITDATYTGPRLDSYTEVQSVAGLTANHAYTVLHVAPSTYGKAPRFDPVGVTGTPVTTGTLTLVASPAAGGTVSGGGSYTVDSTNHSITATPADGYSFVNWTITSGGGTIASETSASTTYTFGSSTAVTATANFQKTASASMGSLTLVASPDGGGTVSGGGSGLYMTDPTSAATYVGTISSGTKTSDGGMITTYTWRNDGSGTAVVTLEGESIITDGEGYHGTAILGSPKTITVGAGGTFTTSTTDIISGSTETVLSWTIASFAMDSSATVPHAITATPADGYNFVNWTITSGGGTLGDPSSASTTYAFGSDTAATVTANFQKTPTTGTLALTASPADGGTVAGGGSFTMDSTAHTITATAASGYTFSGWAIGSGGGTLGDASSASTTYTFGSDTAATVTGTFQKSASATSPYVLLTVSPSSLGSGGGTVTVTWAKSLVPGVTIALATSASSGSATVKAVTDDAGSVSITIPANTITAAITYTITAAGTGSDGITYSNSTTVTEAGNDIKVNLSLSVKCTTNNVAVTETAANHYQVNLSGQ